MRDDNGHGRFLQGAVVAALLGLVTALVARAPLASGLAALRGRIVTPAAVAQTRRPDAPAEGAGVMTVTVKRAQ